MRPMVAVLSRNFKPDAGGGEKYAVSVTRRLAKDFNIHIFSQDYDQIDNVNFHPVPTILKRPRWINLLWFNLYTWVKCRKFPIIHSHEMVPFANITTAHVRCSTPDFNQYRGIRRAIKKVRFFTSIRKLVYLWLEKNQLKPNKNRKIVVVSEMLRKNINNVYHFDTRKYATITPGIDQPAAISQKMARKTLNLSDRYNYLLLATNDFISKGLETAIKSLTLLPDNIHLIVAGNDTPENFIKQAKSLGVLHRVQFIGSRKDMGTVYSASDILIHPTTFDTYGMVALEAMSYGKPVIISNKEYCGISHELENIATLLKNPKDHHEISRSVQMIISSTKYKNSLIKNGLIFTNKKKWSTISNHYRNIYNDLVFQKK